MRAIACSTVRRWGCVWACHQGWSRRLWLSSASHQRSCVHQLIEAFSLQAVAVPGLPQVVTEAVAAVGRCAIQWLQQCDRPLQITGSKALHRQLPELLSPPLKLLHIPGASLVGLHQLLLHQQGSSLIAVVPELGRPLAAAMGLLLRRPLPQPAQSGQVFGDREAAAPFLAD